MNEPAD